MVGLITVSNMLGNAQPKMLYTQRSCYQPLPQEIEMRRVLRLVTTNLEKFKPLPRDLVYLDLGQHVFSKWEMEVGKGLKVYH
jgi:hypothetical protein